MIQETSVNAYKDLPMATLQQKVLHALSYRIDMTNQEIGAMIQKDASTVSGIVVPLRKLGRVVESQKRICAITGKRVIAWKLKAASKTINFTTSAPKMEIFSPEEIERRKNEAMKIL